VGGALRPFVEAGFGIFTGCAVGADASIVGACVGMGAANQLTIFAIFGPAGDGAWIWSNVKGVMLAEAAGARVVWYAGGPPRMRPGVRCRARSTAMVDAVAIAGTDKRAGIVGWVDSPSPPGSPGSWGTMRQAASMGLTVVCFPVGWTIFDATPLGPGKWTYAGGGVWSNAIKWVPFAPYGLYELELAQPGGSL